MSVNSHSTTASTATDSPKVIRRLGQAIKTIIYDDVEFSNAVGFQEMKHEDLTLAARIRQAHNDLGQIADGVLKPSRNEYLQMVDNFFNALLDTMSERGAQHYGIENKRQQLKEHCKHSFEIYTRYPFVNRVHSKPAIGGYLDDDYAGLVDKQGHALKGDALKTAILEIMLGKLNQATDINRFNAIKDEIEHSAAYRILRTSQSKLGTMTFFTGKTSSEQVIDTLIAEHGKYWENVAAQNNAPGSR